MITPDDTPDTPAVSPLSGEAVLPPPPIAPAEPSTFRKALRQKRFTVGLGITLLLVVFAVFARYVAPFGENEVAGAPFNKAAGLLGTDYLGQDVLSRVMYGGREILFIALLGTLLGMVLGIAIGVIAAYGGGWWDEVIMRLNDVILSFPQILLALVVLTALEQPSVWVLIALVGVSHAPRVARLARGVALGIVSRDFVIAAEALGEKRSRVILAEVLPNMNAPLLAEGGLRLTYSIGLVGALGFLGFSADPGAANWGQMIQENRLALATQPWAVLAPVLVIAIFAIGTNLMADGIAQVAQRGDN
jgi:peptide/nickel transport system permease protein